MLLYHLWLLIQKSLRYAWRRRICHCCPKIIFELFIPGICLLFLILVRWIHSTSSTNEKTSSSSLEESKPTRIQIIPSSIISERESIYVFNYTSVFRCPSSDMIITIVDKKLLNRSKRLCPRSYFIASSELQGHNGYMLLNTSSVGHSITYRCQYQNTPWCQNTSLLNEDQNSLQVKHPSSVLCSHSDIQEFNQLLNAYLAIESLLYPPIEKQQLSIYTWPCSSYAYDSMFEFAPRFVLIIILILIDGCILFSFNLLFQALIDEKSQGITELLRLISIRPILNSVAWFLRIFLLQFIISILLILILKSSFDGGIYLSYVSIWLIIPTILFWTIQVLSRAVLVAHFFSSNLKAVLWSWFIYFFSWWLAVSSSVRLPIVLHLIASAWLPFYSIKRLFIILFRINTDLSRSTHLKMEIIFIWLSMLIGSLLIWLLAYYLEQIRPGKYGIPRPWSWPLDSFRNNRIKNEKRRESVTMQMVETLPDSHTTVRVNNLTKTYGRFNTEKQLAVDHVSFKLEKSIIHGLIGHNGAGKTSTMEMMCGLLSCDCGTIEINDKDLHENLSELQTCIGYCPQQDMLFSHLTVNEQLEFYARVRSKGKNVDYNQIQELLIMMDMNTYSQRLCHTLSGGMQRKLSILCAFVGQANVILLGKTIKVKIKNELIFF
jgi:ABC-type branched-subunit amino acid transport system ATPase component